MRKHSHKTATAMLAMALGLFVTQSASAAPPKSFRWNDCTLWKGLNLAPTSTLDRGYLYRMRVFGTDIHATCPVSNDGGAISSADVYVENSLAGGTFSCCMSILTEWGNTAATSSCASTTVSGKTKLSLVVAMPVSLALGTAYIQCDIPSGDPISTSGIIGYTVNRL